jgi:hypothetical protein
MRQPCGVDMAPCTIALHGCAQKEHATFARTKPSSSEGFTGKVWSSYVGSAPNFSLYCSLEHPAASSDSFGLFTSVKGNAAFVETAKKAWARDSSALALGSTTNYPLDVLAWKAFSPWDDVRPIPCEGTPDLLQVVTDSGSCSEESCARDVAGRIRFAPRLVWCSWLKGNTQHGIEGRSIDGASRCLASVSRARA